MLDFLSKLFGSDFMPHVYCLRDSDVIWLHVISDAVIGCSYFAIPVILLSLLRRRRDLVFPWMFALFGLFIFACGSTHFLAIWTLWHPIYRFEGLVKAITAGASLLTASLLYRLFPKILLLPTPAQFQREIEERRKAEQRVQLLNLELEDRVRVRTEELAKSNADLQAANLSVHKSELLYRTLVEAMPQLVWTADDRGHCEYLSSQWEEYTGRSQNDQLGFGWVEVIHPDDRDKTFNTFVAAAASRSEYMAEYRIRKYDGSYRWFKARGIPMDAPGLSDTWLGTCTDIDSEKLSTTLLQKHNRHLEDLTFATAHHLQEPLRTLGLQSQILIRQTRGRLSDADLEIVSVIDETTRRLSQLLRDFLAYSEANMMSANRQVVSLAGLIDSAIQQCRPRLDQAKATIAREYADFDVIVNAKPIRSVIEHLIENAIKYRDDHRPFSIRISTVEMAADVVICVADNGIGIDSRFHETIFGLFKRLHAPSDYPGTGLGLALCQRILEQHGQKIWVESEPGAGSKFCLTLRKADSGSDSTLAARTLISGGQSV